MQKMLLVYPNNFLQGAQGTNTRVKQLVIAFKELGFQIDYLGYDNFSGSNSFAGFDKLNSGRPINNLYVYDFAKGYTKGGKTTKIGFFLDKVKRKLRNSNPENNSMYLSDWAPAGVCNMFDDITAKNDYDIIVLFYTYQANLLKDKQLRAKKIYFMEDSMFLQQYSWDNRDKPGITLGKLLDEELARIKYFDEIFCISYDEKIMYEKLTGKSMHFLPHIQPSDVKPVMTPLEDRKWDVMFVGFNNPFNAEGLNWFLHDVYPHLNKDIKIVFVGSATKDLDVIYCNIDIIPFAPDLDEIFQNAKVAICPMFRGTGMKIKVVEAMSKGLPVVCNDRGVDGLPDKMESGCLVTQDAAEFADYITRLLKDGAFYAETVNRTARYYDRLFERGKYLDLLRNVFC